jgi:hypothetical protein
MLIEASGSERINPPDGTKFYAPFVVIDGRVRSLMNIKRTRVAANEYALRFSERFSRMALYVAIKKANQTPRAKFLALLGRIKKVFLRIFSKVTHGL